jgi:hypothetical protein
MPAGPRLWVSAVLIESGVSGLLITLVLRGRFAWIFALIIVAGFGAFLACVIWLRHPRPRPPALRSPDPAVWHAAASFASLGIASALGIWLTIADASPLTLRIPMAYGVFGLVGFLAQMVVGTVRPPEIRQHLMLDRLHSPASTIVVGGTWQPFRASKNRQSSPREHLRHSGSSFAS